MDRASLEALLESVVRELGKVDILVNAAGRTKRTPTVDLSEKDWNDIIETNLTGTLRACQIFGRHMIEAPLWTHHQHRLAYVGDLYA